MTKKDVEKLKIVGKSKPRIDGIEKVTGRAVFVDDIYMDNMLFGAVHRTKYAHAEIKAIKIKKALKVKGVKCVLTADDLPGKLHFGNIIKDQPFLAKNKVRYFGDGIALIAASSRDIAYKAASKIDVDYNPLKVLNDPLKALNNNEVKIYEKGNLIVHHKVRHGNVDKGFKCADFILEKEFTTPFIEHAYIEPEGAVASPDSDGGVIVYGGMQHPFSTRRVVSAACNLPLSMVRIIQTTLGGGFGGKDEAASLLCARAAVLALHTQRPVKLVNTREESFVESYKRHPYIMKYKIGVKNGGKITAVKAEIIADGGAYTSMSPFVTWRSVVQASGPYECPNVKTDVYAVHTNNTYTGAMRGFGSPQVNFAIESLMDILAEKTGLDPVQIRLINCYKQGLVTPTGQVLNGHNVSMEQILRNAAEKSEILIPDMIPIKKILGLKNG